MVKKNINRRLPLLIPAIALIVGGISSCNKSTTPTEEIAVTISNVAVKEFKLSANSKVMANLDSVFFSIDLENGVIFNADSLPKGTDVTKLVPVITFGNALSAAEIVMSGGTVRTDTVNYLENSTDSIDFSGDVKLNVTAYDETNKYTYTIKVNVHNMVPDSLMWAKVASSELPSRLLDPVAQKSVEKSGKVYSMIEERDGSYTWASASSLAEADWTKTEVALPFEPDMCSLAAGATSFWILDADGNLMESADGMTWVATGEKWVTLIGPYLDCMLGVKETADGLRHCHYPASADVADPAVSPDFPLYNRSELCTIETKWTEEPTAIFVGGSTADGVRSNHTWGFDGTTWATIDNTSTPALEGANLFRYVVYRKTGGAFKQIAYDAWIVLGGVLEDGSYNRNLYVSFDNGVTWKRSSDQMSMPDVVPNFSNASVIVLDSTLDADLEDAWKKEAPVRLTRSSYVLDGYDISWECPYIYVIGGVMPSGRLSDTIWRAVIARLAFTPII